jgi:hypothetical protein
MTTLTIKDAGRKQRSQPVTARTSHPRSTPTRSKESKEQTPPPNIDEVLRESFPASDPPSWSGAISRVAPKSGRHQRLMRRIRAEFLEMPGLCLTMPQARRLWSLDTRECEAVLNALVDARFLRRNARGLFVLFSRGKRLD